MFLHHQLTVEKAKLLLHDLCLIAMPTRLLNKCAHVEPWANIKLGRMRFPGCDNRLYHHQFVLTPLVLHYDRI